MAAVQNLYTQYWWAHVFINMSLHFNLGLNLTEKLNCFLNKTKLKRKKEDWFGAGQVS